MAQEASSTAVMVHWPPPASSAHCSVSSYTVEYRQEGEREKEREIYTKRSRGKNRVSYKEIQRDSYREKQKNTELERYRDIQRDTAIQGNTEINGEEVIQKNTETEYKDTVRGGYMRYTKRYRDRENQKNRKAERHTGRYIEIQSYKENMMEIERNKGIQRDMESKRNTEVQRDTRRYKYGERQRVSEIQKHPKK